jgi:hypothetical protein
VPSGHHEFELAAAGSAEESDRLLPAVTSRIILKLLHQPFVEVGVVQSEKNLTDKFALVFRVKLAPHVQGFDVGDIPIVRYMSAEQAAVVFVIPVEADLLALLRRERIVQLLDQRLGMSLRLFRGGKTTSSQRGCRSSADDLNKLATLHRMTGVVAIRAVDVKAHGSSPAKKSLRPTHTPVSMTRCFQNCQFKNLRADSRIHSSFLPFRFLCHRDGLESRV